MFANLGSRLYSDLGGIHKGRSYYFFDTALSHSNGCIFHLLGSFANYLKVQRADLTCDVIRKVAPFVLTKL